MIEFVGERSGKFAEHGHAREVKEFSAAFVQFALRPLAGGNVPAQPVHARDAAGQPESVNSAAVVPRAGSQVLGRSIVDRRG